MWWTLPRMWHVFAYAVRLHALILVVATTQELYLEDVLQATRWTPDRACDCLRGGGGKGLACLSCGVFLCIPSCPASTTCTRSCSNQVRVCRKPSRCGQQPQSEAQHAAKRHSCIAEMREVPACLCC